MARVVTAETRLKRMEKVAVLNIKHYGYCSQEVSTKWKERNWSEMIWVGQIFSLRKWNNCGCFRSMMGMGVYYIERINRR